MKRAASPNYFSSDDESDDLLVQAMEQKGGALPSPLFAFTFSRVGQRRRWRNTVRGMTYNATLEQLRDANADDNVGEALTEALCIAIERKLREENVRPHDRVNFSITAHGFEHAFQSINFQVREFLQRTLRIDTLLQSLAEKLNSNESIEPDQGFEVTMVIVAMPTPGTGHRKKYNPGRKCMDKALKNKHSVIAVKNKDELCCARAIVIGRARCHREESTDAYRRYENIRNHRPIQGVEARELHRLAGVPEGPCGYEELQQFQTALGNSYQLHVISHNHPFLTITQIQ